MMVAAPKEKGEGEIRRPLPPRQRQACRSSLTGGATVSGGSSDISKAGAKGDGKMDSTKAVNEAWAAACGKDEGADRYTL
ncbi:hypothetical protein HU200_066998 [Digitaria exilis]|uniref:Uncharacterized protein n=1 Tax=Digitaria exilis TaxID=1010633 RepID=A0A835A0U5_9POAL|nr:hypothetical protein HU200_066998 [Digitaria exilis]